MVCRRESAAGKEWAIVSVWCWQERETLRLHEGMVYAGYNITRGL